VSYQVLARKYRPQRFDDVVGQDAVTRTLRNAVASGRLAHAFVFAGPRGCGKTTTARILARALNCVNGPTPDPCGNCDACTEIAQGRDIDVLEIDAASHTGIDNIREVVIAGLAIAPVRNRYKIFIIDEVHQLSAASFNALLKSIEEPPPHVVFIMATTELHKIPDTILSRAQLFEFRTISARAIARQLRQIATAEGLDADEASLALIARAAEGSMRDAQSALDQVIAFAGSTIRVDDVSAVLGLVGRDLLLGLIEAVVQEDGPGGFELADRAVESGTDLRLVCRELARVVRDMMVLSVDPDRAGDGELGEGERERLLELGRQFSREDLMRAFDLLSKAENDLRTSAHPRYHFEMVLLRWMHLRRLVPLVDLLEELRGAAPTSHKLAPTSGRLAPTGSKLAPTGSTIAPAGGTIAPTGSTIAPTGGTIAPTSSSPLVPANDLKSALLDAIRTGKGFFYNTVVAQAQRIDIAGDVVTFAFLPAHQALRRQFDQSREWLEAAAARVAGRPITVTSVQADTEAKETGTPSARRDLKAEAMSSSGVKALFEVFPAEIRDVEEIEE
jgi:DNA polymerase-3 subunit gamma/tau